MSRLLLISLAGGLGTAARYLLSGVSARALGPGFPYGTLIVNILGSFVLGVVMYLGVRTHALSPGWRAVVGIGFCGGFTTYSTFNFETMQYLQDRAWALAGINVVVTLVACMVAGLGGWGAAGLVASR